MEKNFLNSALKLSLAGLLLVGCGGSASTSSSSSASTGSSSNAAPETEKKIEKESTGGVVEGKTPTTEQVDHVVIAANSASTDASPYAMMTPTRGGVHEALYGNLFYVEPLHFIEDAQGYIGKSITRVDDFTWDIELYDNVVDSKGNPIKAQDVLWSYEYSFKNQEFLAYGTDVEYFKVVDDTHLQLKVKKNVPGVVEKLVCASAITIVNQEWFENAPDEEKQNDPATTGRYTVKNNVSGSEIVVEARTDYWKADSECCPAEQANVKVIDFKVITEESMRAIALENKEVDLARVTATNLHRFYDLDNSASLPGYNVWMGTTSPMYHLIFCNMDPSGASVLSKDVNLRKAALYAMSSEDIMLASGNTYDTAEIMHSFASQAQGGYQDKWLSPDWDYFNFDTEKAHEFYKASGHADGEVEVTLLTSISLYSDSVRSVIIANLEEAGFKVNSLAVDQALFLNYRFEPDQWDLIMDVKSAGDYVVTGWDSLFNPVGYSNGSVCFTHDDKLVELLEASQADPSDENINAFNDYMIDQAICKALYTALTIWVADEDIMELKMGTGGVMGMASVYSTEFQPAEMQ